MKSTATDRESDLARSRRKRDVRAQTVNVARMSRRELYYGRLLYPVEDHDFGEGRPRTRAECASVERPCPFVSCKHHLYLDVSERTGAIKLNFPDLEPHEMPADRSCALDIADRGGSTLEEVGAAINVTRERVRQLEVVALAIVRDGKGLDGWREDGTQTKRRLPILEERDDLEYEDAEDADEWIPEGSGIFAIAEDD